MSWAIALIGFKSVLIDSRYTEATRKENVISKFSSYLVPVNDFACSPEINKGCGCDG
jgi:hypothetical protein